MWWRGPGLAGEIRGIRAGREILKGIHPCRVSRFDATLHGRTIIAPAWFPSLWAVKPRHVRILAELTNDPEATGVVLAAHPSGWVRQAALPLLEECSTPLAMGMLVVRSNDWVEPVRLEAQSRLRAVAAADQRLVLVMPALEELARTRSRSADFARGLLALARERLTSATLIEGLRDVSPRVRRSSARLLVDRGVPEGALDLALEQDDTITAWLVAEGAARHDPSEALSRRLLAARSPRVRRLGLLRLIQQGGEGAALAARAGLFDSHTHVRSEAQEYLSELAVDPSAIYVECLGPRPAISILGLAETASEQDASRVLPYVSHSSARVRGAACHALATLALGAHRAAVLALARDPSPRVAQRAVEAIVGARATPSELDQLWSIVATAPARRSVLRAFESLDRWAQLVYAFRSITSGIAKDEGMLLLEHVLSRWNSSFTAPSAERGRELASLLPTMLRRLGPSVGRRLEFTVSSHLGPLVR